MISKDKCKYITPVPGGVGPMTVAMLAKNILKAYKMQKKQKSCDFYFYVQNSNKFLKKIVMLDGIVNKLYSVVRLIGIIISRVVIHNNKNSLFIS